MGQSIAGSGPAFFDTAPVISDGPAGLVLIEQPDGSVGRLVPFDVFCAYMAAGEAYIRERYARQEASVKPIIPMCRGCEHRRH